MKHALTLFLLLLLSTALLGYAAPLLKFSSTIRGITGAPLDNAIARLNAEQKVPQGALTPALIHRFYRDAPEVIKKAIQPYGYFKATVKGRLTQRGNQWSASYSVQPGPPLRVARVDLKITGEGAKDRSFQRFIARFPLKKGAVLKTEKFNNAKQRLFDIASRKGYFKASLVKSEIQIDLRRYRAVITLHYNTGPRYRFGSTLFSRTPFSLSFLRRFLNYNRGDRFNDRKLQNLQEELSSSNYFETVVITPKHQQADKAKQVPIHIRLTPAKSQQYLFGAGYGTDTKFRGLFGIELRRLNATGHRFRAQVNGSAGLLNATTTYSIPGRRPAKDRYDISAAVETINQSWGSSRSEKLVGSYTTAFNRWQQTLSLNLQKEKFRNINQPWQRATMLVPSVNWFTRRSDNPLRPKNGYRIRLLLQGTSDALFDTQSFFQARLDAKGIISPTRNDRLIFRATVGLTEVNNLSQLPLTFQFFTGGAQTLRGYGYNQIGPGRDLAVGSAELQHRLFGNIYAAAFFDVGNTANSFLTKPHRSAGAGVVWLSPIGAFELTAGKALDDPGQPWRIQFSMGPEL